MTATLRQPSVSEFLRSMTWRSVASVSGMAGGLVLVALAARRLPVTVAPTLFLTLTALIVAPMLGRAGVATHAVAELARLRAVGDRNGALTVVQRVLLITGAGSVLSGMPLALAVILRTPGEGRLTLWLVVSTLLVCETIRLTVSDLFSGMGHPLWSAMLGHQPRAAFGAVSATLYMALKPQPTLTGLLTSLGVVSLVLTVSGLGGLALAAHRWRHTEASGFEVGAAEPMSEISTHRALRSAIRAGMPLLLIDLALFAVGRLDVWIAARAFPAEEAVRYSTASVMANQLGLPIGLLALAICPLIAGLNAQGQLPRLEQLLRTVASVSIAVFVPVLVVLVVWGEWLFGALFGPALRSAAPLFLILSIGAVALVVGGLGQPVLMMTGHARSAAGLSLVIVALWVPAGWYAAHRGGPMALAAVSSSATAALHGGLCLLARSRAKVWVLPSWHVFRMVGELLRPAPALAEVRP